MKAFLITFLTVFCALALEATEKPVTNRIKEVTVFLEGAQVLREGNVRLYGGRVSGVSGSRKKEVSRSPEVARMQNQLTTEFVIRQPYTIPSDGKQYQVAMQQHQLRPCTSIMLHLRWRLLPSLLQVLPAGRTSICWPARPVFSLKENM